MKTTLDVIVQAIALAVFLVAVLLVIVFMWAFVTPLRG